MGETPNQYKGHQGHEGKEQFFLGALAVLGVESAVA
jgi:hypothetical protein